MNSRGKTHTACLVVISTAMVLCLCGCAAVLFEGAEAGEALAAGAEIAPAVEAGAIESSALDSFWSRGLVPTFDVSLDQDIVSEQIGRTRFNINLGSGTVKTGNGVPVAQIEGSRIYRIYPRGTHELVAEIETRLAKPITAYSDPTVLDRVRILKTGELVQVVRVEKGWYQIRYLDHDVSVLLWVFGPDLISTIDGIRLGNGNPQTVSFQTRVPTRELILSTLKSAEKVRSDLGGIIPQDKM